MANGYQATTTESLLTGQPIKVIVTGTNKPSDNRKTGDMLQVWILSATSKPSDAVQNGDDESVCGDCVHRPALAKENNVAECYVEVGKAPNSVYKAEYPTTPASRKVPVRLGSWGDPGAVKLGVLQSIVAQGNGKHTGYTHQWANPNIDPGVSTLLMASVDNPSEAIKAQTEGWRTFRVRKESEPLMANEIACPASKESGYKTTCNKCLLCAGTSKKAKNIAIIEH